MSRAGVYKIDITPPIGIDFIGYHRPEGISDIDERIYSTAFVFEHNDNKSIFISVDNIGMLIEDTSVIRERIAAELDVSYEKITVVFTHTHSGPATVSSSEIVKAYKTILIENTVKAAVMAHERMHPSEVGWNVTLGDIGVNRREETADGKVKMGTNEKGVVDKRIGLMAVRHQQDHSLSGAIVFCTAHPNVLKSDSDCLSGDYPGETRRILEHILGCPVIIVQGASGNVNARYRGSREAVEKMAYALSGGVLTMIPSIEYKKISRLHTNSTIMPMPLIEIPEPEGIERMAANAEEQWGVNTSKWHTHMLEKYEQNDRHISIDVEIQAFHINEGSFSGIPMEPFSESALEIQGKLKNPLAFFGGYTNGYLGYLPTKEAYPYGGYEVELNPVVYGPITNLWMPPVEDTSQKVVHKVLEMHRESERG
ncbi:neutral/alkaline non-lysosomal ceramidase N-terminal domain-containing protein [Rossellomorea sp. SC111]|uniref:neutral/alkaline non-lysosomal ceramidase N-terminal domain-containing protein n=1 Tax=Rossellomorea sp. SC111 TaxID=2968985 RepID=UPI00215B1892|nr:neutral/alkaline non-lysosomal ceramidase N-terminal domain-containing protein [Rossellomorea sp. SC111]MCR8847960.1 neutral/alkaline non-lysosomal ceramidase N-terminal domain-containing protein [Rossellomorea sp. SC111]